MSGPAPTTLDFPTASRAALADPQLRSNFRRAMDGLMAKRAVQFADDAEWRAMRELGAAVRRRALARLPDLLERLEANCQRNGIKVHWAATIAEANATILRLVQAEDTRLVVKGKSMVTEEMRLNAHLEAHGIECVETDLGEYIVQLDGAMPSHIVMPAIHMSRQQIAHLFKERIRDAAYTEDVDQLTALARRVLRRKFQTAGVGISGVNAAVAETGTLCLIENEGNGRMSTTAPPVHIAVMGLEKVVERLEDVVPILSLLPRSATAQPITTYVNMITHPRRNGELDGPRAVHLVILDNGRSAIHASPDRRDTLRCIRCGACMNHCPVYSRVGGHAYQAPYPGPLGQILMPQIEGLKQRGDLPHACTMCNACVEVCPVRIPIVAITGELRQAAANPDSAIPGSGSRRNRVEDLVWALWGRVMSTPLAHRMATRWLRRLYPLAPANLPVLGTWMHSRSRPRLAARNLHELARQRGIPDE